MSAGRAQRAGAAGAAVAGAGAALGAATATACCVGPVVSPLIVAVLGVSGAAAVAGLKPLAPYLLGGSLAVLGYGFWSVYRPRPACAAGESPCPTPRWIRLALWTAAAIWLVSLVVTVLTPT